MNGGKCRHLISGILMLLVSGLIYAWSIISGPLRAEFPEWNESQLGFTYTATMLSFGVGQLLSGALSKRIAPATSIRISGLLFFAGLTCASFAQSIFGLYLFYGAFCGAATGFVYITVLSSVLSWFPERKGLINGVMLMVFGFSSSLIGKVYQMLTPNAIGGWRVSFRYLGILILVIYLVGSIRFSKQETQEVSASSGKQQRRDVAPSELLRSKSFYLFYAWNVCVSCAGMIVMSQSSGIIGEISPQMSYAEAATIASLIFIASAFGRVSGGIIYEKMGRSAALMMINGFFVSSQLLFFGALSNQSTLCMILGFLLGGFGYGCISPTNTTLISSYYGMKHYSSNLSIVNSALFIVAFSSTGAGLIFDRFQTYRIVYGLLIAILMVGSVCTMLLLKQMKKEEAIS